MYSNTARRYNRRPALKKRWYIDTGIPKSVPFIGGTYLKAGSGALNKRKVDALIKRETRRLEVNKVKVADIAGLGMSQATWYTLNPLGNIPIGTGELNRLGTDIFVTKIRLRMQAVNNASLTGTKAGPVHLRVTWLRTSAQILGATDTFSAAGLGNSDMLQQGFTNGVFGQFDQDRVSVLSDTVVTIPAGNFTGQLQAKFAEVDCPLGAGVPYKYTSTTSNFSTQNKQIYCVLQPFTFAGVTATDTVASISYSWSCEFKDSR